MGSGFRMLIKWFLGLLGMEHLFIYIYILYCYYILRKYPITKFRVLGLGPLKKSSLNL